jgi:hypothetical protein
MKNTKTTLFYAVCVVALIFVAPVVGILAGALALSLLSPLLLFILTTFSAVLVLALKVTAVVNITIALFLALAVRLLFLLLVKIGKAAEEKKNGSKEAVA